MLSLCPDSGGRDRCSGSVLVAPFRTYIIFIIIIIIVIIIFRWVATVGSTGYGRPHRRVRIDARCRWPGHVTYTVPYSALPLDPLMCVLTPGESPPPSQLLYCVGLSILTAVSL